jgi:hypothetical protein
MMREGAEDYQYLWLLQNALDGLPEAMKQTEKAREAARILVECASEVVGGTGDAEVSSKERKPNAQSSLVPMNLRGRVGDLIEELGR